MEEATHFFLGANSGQGFQNLFEPFCRMEHHNDLLVLKGGPGSGKSTMMKKIGKAMEARGEKVEYLHCSGDPFSLDGINIPGIRTAIVDGTSPHIIEPKYPAAVERYVNLGQFYDIAAAKAARNEIVRYTDECSEAYRRAYRALAASRQMDESANVLAAEGLDYGKLQRRTKGIIAREIRGIGSGGSDRYRFLESVTYSGDIVWFKSAEKIAQRIYHIYDSFSLAGSMLDQIHEAAKARGYGSILCPDPEHMDRLRHILIPELELAFVTIGRDVKIDSTPYRRIHIDAMVSAEHLQRWKGRLKFLVKMRKTLRQEGIESLKDAKASHDALEALYYPRINISGLDSCAAQELERIVGYLGQ